VYFRFFIDKRVIVVLNNTSKNKSLGFSRFRRINCFKTIFKDIFYEHYFILKDTLEVPSKTI
jgi:hypothetical protein